MKYIFRNIHELIKNERFIFLIILMCVFLSSIVLNFSYGLYQNYEREKDRNTESMKTILTEINKDHAPTHKQVQEFVESLSPETTEGLTFFIAGTLEYYTSEHYNTLDSRFTYSNGTYGVPLNLRENVEKELNSGRMVSDYEEANGVNVAVVCNYGQGWDANTAEIGDGKGYIEMWGKRYKVIGEDKLFLTPIIPFLSVPDDFVYDDIMMLTCDDVFTRSSYEELKTNAAIYMPDAVVFPDLNLPDTDSVKLYNNLIFISLLISVLSSLNLAVLYQYLLEKRMRSLSVMRVCGATKMQSVGIYLAECICISIPTYFAGTVFYIFLLNTVIGKVFDYITEAYSWKVYCLIFLTYILILAVVMFFMLVVRVKKNIIEQWKDGVN